MATEPAAAADRDAATPDAERSALLIDWGGVLTSNLFVSFNAYCIAAEIDPKLLLGRFHIGHQVFRRLFGTGGKTGERERRAHDLHEATARYRINPLRAVLRKLLLHRRVELRCPGQLIERTPVLFAGLRGELFAHIRQGQLCGSILHVRSFHAVFFEPVVSHRWHTSQLERSRGDRML